MRKDVIGATRKTHEGKSLLLRKRLIHVYQSEIQKNNTDTPANMAEAIIVPRLGQTYCIKISLMFNGILIGFSNVLFVDIIFD